MLASRHPRGPAGTTTARHAISQAPTPLREAVPGDPHHACGSTQGSAAAACPCAGARRPPSWVCLWRGASTKRRRSRSRCARPHICRFSIFRRVIGPSTGLGLPGQGAPGFDGRIVALDTLRSASPRGQRARRRLLSPRVAPRRLPGTEARRTAWGECESLCAGGVRLTPPVEHRLVLRRQGIGHGRTGLPRAWPRGQPRGRAALREVAEHGRASTPIALPLTLLREPPPWPTLPLPAVEQRRRRGIAPTVRPCPDRETVRAAILCDGFPRPPDLLGNSPERPALLRQMADLRLARAPMGVARGRLYGGGQERVPAHPQVPRVAEAHPSFAAQGDAERYEALAEPPRAPGPGRRHRGQAFGDDPAWARALAAEPLAPPELEPHAIVRPGQVGQRPRSVTVDATRRGRAEGTRHHGLDRAHRQGDPGGGRIAITRLKA